MSSPTPRIEVSGAGVGEISDADLERRAREIAIGDGRSEPNEVDYEHARRDLHVPSPVDETLLGGIEPIAAGTDLNPPPTSGHKTPNHFLENEDRNDSADLIREGLDEADHDTRTESGQLEN